MRHNELEEAIVKYIKINKNFNTSDLCLSSDEIHGNEQIIAEVHGITQHCRPDVIAYNFFGEKFHIFGEAKTSNDFFAKDQESVNRHNRQINVMLNALKVKRNKKKYLIYACEVQCRNEVELMLNNKKKEFDADDVDIIILDQIHNSNLF